MALSRAGEGMQCRAMDEAKAEGDDGDGKEKKPTPAIFNNQTKIQKTFLIIQT